MTVELLGASDVAERLGVSRRRVSALVKVRKDFPPPFAITPRGVRLWRAEDVEEWARLADRSVGRPRKQSSDGRATPERPPGRDGPR
jgi:predicted DNA-binding transcriptional regulator AlpA